MMPIHDPSGYVYEAVPSNRLQDVTASIYYQKEEGEPVLWNAEDYEQINPQTTDGSDPSGSTVMKYTRPIVLMKNVAIQAIAIKEGMLDSEIAVFEYAIDIETGINQPNHTVVLFVRNQTLVIRGLEPGESYTVYSILGTVVTQGIVTDHVEQQIPLSGKGIFVISTPAVKAKVVVN